MKTTGYSLAGLFPRTELYVKSKKWKEKIYKENVVWCHNFLTENENNCKQNGTEHTHSTGPSTAACDCTPLHRAPASSIAPFPCLISLFELVVLISVLGVQRCEPSLSPATPQSRLILEGYCGAGSR